MLTKALLYRLYSKNNTMKNRFFKLLGIIAVAGFVLTGCGPTAHIETANNANLNDYRTFAWAEKGDRNTRSTIMEERIKEAITYELQRKGYQLSNRKPDAILSYDVLVERSSRMQSDPMYSWGGYRTFYNPYSRRFYNVYYPSQFIGYDHYNIPTREGTITITMVDARTDKTVLQGWATDEINSRKMSNSEVDRIVRAIFKKWDNYNKGGRYNDRYNDRNNRYNK